MVRESVDGLRARTEAARKRERDARAAAARLAREMSALSRRQETQRLCTLGRAWGAYADMYPSEVEKMKSFLATYITRQTDIDVIAGTRWAIPDDTFVPAPGWLHE